MTFIQQFPNAKINTLRYLTVHDPYDQTPNWSRRYEWNYAINAVMSESPSPFSVLNAACGFAGIHATFSMRLEPLCGRVFNCDMQTPDFEDNFKNFFKHDIFQPFPQMYDVTLCISTLEDFLDPVLIERALCNLAQYTRRRLIITADIYDRVKPEWFTHMVGRDSALNDNHALTGANSSYAQHEFAHLKILVLDISL